MNILDIDFKKYIPDIVEALTIVFGEQYRSIIEERANKILNLTYVDLEGVISYYYFLENYKKREMSLKFLKQVGIDISKYELNDNLVNNEIDDLISNYIGGISPTYKEYGIGILSFANIEYKVSQDIIVNQQIEFINFLKNSNKITLENYEEFKKTEEFKIILKQINSYLEVYNNIYDEMIKFYETTKFYKDYISKETNREKDLFLKKKIELYEDISNKLPVGVKNLLNSKDNIMEKIKILGDIDGKMDIEYFSKEDEEKINNPDTDINEKMCILYYRFEYFKKLGIDINLENVTDIQISYNKYVNREEIKNLVPSFELIEEIKMRKQEKYKEIKEEFIYSSDTFRKNASQLPKKALYNIINRRTLCITGGNDGVNFIPILCYTVSAGMGGYLDYFYLHEFVHGIETTVKNKLFTFSCGFDIGNAINEEKNPYITTKRKYEMINETFTDIFTIEARNILHNKGIYFLEPKEIIKKNVNDINTDSILKNMVKPLLEKYRLEIIKARLTGNINELCDVIGNENFEIINDSINKVHYLINQGLKDKIVRGENNHPLVIEYNKEMLRLEQLYYDIDTKRHSMR